MYVIVSHDVDHLFGKDHWFRDLIYPKLFVRTSLQLVKKEITVREWYLRNSSCFHRKRHHIDELMEFDKKYGIESVFFFGMNQGIGMSYKPLEAYEIMKRVKENGFEVGVHGICFDTYDGVKAEYDTFTELMGFEPNGIRMHYVRFDKRTFEIEDKVGYTYDTTEFDKKMCGTQKNPYKVGKMWEFPLTIMDGYLPQNFEAAQKRTIDILNACKKKELKFVSILFHDYQFCEDYKAMNEWYRWLIDYLNNSDEFSFISYVDAIRLMEQTVSFI